MKVQHRNIDVLMKLTGGETLLSVQSAIEELQRGGINQATVSVEEEQKRIEDEKKRAEQERQGASSSTAEA